MQYCSDLAMFWLVVWMMPSPTLLLTAPCKPLLFPPKLAEYMGLRVCFTSGKVSNDFQGVALRHKLDIVNRQEIVYSSTATGNFT